MSWRCWLTFCRSQRFFKVSFVFSYYSTVFLPCITLFYRAHGLLLANNRKFTVIVFALKDVRFGYCSFQEDFQRPTNTLLTMPYTISELSWTVELNITNKLDKEEEKITLSPDRSEVCNRCDVAIPPIIPLAVLSLHHNHKCYRCGKRYSTKGTLNRHLRFECGQKPKFFCPLCQRPFTRNDTLTQHLKVMHPRVPHSRLGV